MKVKEWKKGLSHVMKVVKKSNIPILQRINVENGYMWASDMETYLAYHIYCDNFKGLLPAFEFNSIIKGLNSEDKINLVNQGKEILMIVNNDTKITLETEDRNHFPKVPIVPPHDIDLKYQGMISKEDVKKIKIASKFARNNLDKILIGNNIVGTDGFVMYWERKSGSYNEERILPKNIARYLKNSTYSLHENRKDLGVFFTPIDGKGVIYTKKRDEKYPAYLSVIPNDPPFTINTDKKILMSKVNHIIKVSDLDIKEVRFNIPFLDNKIKLSTLNSDSKVCFESLIDFDKVSPKLPEEDYVFALNAKFLLSILKECEGEKVTFKFSTPHRPVLINDNFLIMPITI